ncbi:MAG TPA: low molecular weight protein-tyrosine-phosphatase [Alphaproteobacteria bacterium]|nr:low molecular weight protein-tyrosine-phosphatase [Alphaproteobacteria bacterium]HNS44630.1 low molecular weight protein-tyrosine-phosphatase [Alphaproteobacteria bacterium]
MTYKILFVCTGNICRSPMAEAVARHKIGQIGQVRQSSTFEVDSAGTHSYHVGERPDPRTLKLCEEKGIGTGGMLARQIVRSDFEDFDLILGMDRGHVSHMERIAPPEFHPKIALMMDYAGFGEQDVPDPYYGGIEGFHEVYNMLDRGLDQLISTILTK